MRRLFYKGILADQIEIGGPDAHHLMHVMRAKPGQEVIVVDDENQVARMEMTAFSPDTVTLELLERLDADTESPTDLTLAACLLKADKMDFVVQKAVELGVTRIVPVASHNCVVRYDAKKAKQRCERWQKIANEAAKQCGRTALVKVLPIETLQKFLCHAPYEDDMDSEFLFCYENEEKLSLRECLQRTTAERYLLLVGPEGGFTLEEAEAIVKAGGQSVTLGPRILRAETACVAGLSIVQYEKGDLGS
ncbi:16S rRNA (uracil(1498)-N(3))-methyltransferase [Mitsuokella sp.]|uniref:16S rRNA (uracil(1498)-N(3))-methyltransferase n=1 Tax=Mitsuokella sp. TaxID=2049034 RepID=UPI003D7E3AD5